MKKLLFIIIVVAIILSNTYNEIPKESIRFRVIANSNEEKDQKLKRKIVSNLSTNIKRINSSDNINDIRKNIKKELPTFEKIVEKTISEEKSNNSFHINYGKNYFPEKIYNNKTYKEGEYESLVITIGEGLGDNFWCVLFPPLCFVEEEKTEYKSFLKEIIDKILK